MAAVAGASKINTMPKVFIALATYQGAKYLRPLIQSIRRQSYADWTLLARDDGSTDATPKILRELARRDARIEVLDDGGGHQGAAGNFGRVMQNACDRGADYLFLADQDDVWQADKLEKLLALLRAGQPDPARPGDCPGSFPGAVPVSVPTKGDSPIFGPPLRVVARKSGQSPVPRLVYSDLVVVDGRLRTLQRSFFRHSRLRHEGREPLRTLLGRSFVLGCASGMNRPLLELALPLPGRIASHDWWVALCAAAAGQIAYLPQPTIWYRRHEGNASGPAGFWAGWNPWQHPWAARWQSGYRSFRQSLDQALALRQRLDERAVSVTGQTRQCLDRFCTLFERPTPAWRRTIEMLRMGVPAIDLPRRLLYYLCLWCLPVSR